jgi:hypothetical protein
VAGMSAYRLAKLVTKVIPCAGTGRRPARDTKAAGIRERGMSFDMLPLRAVTSRQTTCALGSVTRPRRSCAPRSGGASSPVWRERGWLSRTPPHKQCGACLSQGEENTSVSAYAEAMSNPWSTLVETLSGAERKTPHSWPERRVHRMMDDAPPGDPRTREARPVVKVGRGPLMSQGPAPVTRSRCPCRECQLGLSRAA